MMKDRLDNVLEIMDYIYDNHESELCTENALQEKFGEQRCRDFERYAMGGLHPYAQTHTIYKQRFDIPTAQEVTDEFHVVVLTQKGVRTVYKVREARGHKSIHDMLHSTQAHINVLLLGTLMVIAISSAWTFLRDLVQSKEEMTLLGLGLTVSLAIILVYIGLMSKHVQEKK